MPEMTALPLACPRCGSILKLAAPDELECCEEGCHKGCPKGLRFSRVAGIWRMLLPEREALFNQFIHEYETIRLAEGRQSQDPAYYRSLPYRDLSGRMSADWRIRAASYTVLRQRIIAPLSKQMGKGLRVLDLGAGNAWLSNLLAHLGHWVTALDLITNDYDGLGCYRFYETLFTAVQAEFDHLPIPDRSADLVIFNASLHYSTNFLLTLKEARRVLAPAGRLVILDTPLYHNPDSGRQMVREREANFRKQYGFPSNALASESFLTYTRLEELGNALQMRWRLVTPFYGWKWAARPLLARLRGRREPARFHVIEGSV